jgi:hypothetical protein
MNSLDSTGRARPRIAARCSPLALLALFALAALDSACQSTEAGTAKSRSAAREIDQVAWDQPEVVRLTAQLSKQTTAVRQALRKEPTFQDQARMQSKAGFRLMETLRVLETSTRQLAARAEKGGGLEETLPVVKKIGSLLRRARDEARSQMLAAPTLAAIAQARETLRALSPFYGTQLDPAETPA